MKTTKNNIGLDSKKSNLLAKDLNKLLANFQIYYQTLRGLHWNIKGKHFFELHVKFEELYTDAQLKIDMIAERILTLDGNPLHTFEDYSKNAIVTVGKDISDGKKGVAIVVESLQKIIILERSILKEANELDDEGTVSMLSDFITQQEKEIWMYSSWLKN